MPERTKKVMRSCRLCGTMERCPEGGLPPGWSIFVEERGVEYMCSECARRNIRAIEGKLPEEWWE